MKFRKIYIYGFGMTSQKTLYKVLKILHDHQLAWQSGRSLIDKRFISIKGQEIKTLILYNLKTTDELNKKCCISYSDENTNTIQDVQNNFFFDSSKCDIAINCRKLLSNINEFEKLLNSFYQGEPQ